MLVKIGSRVRGVGTRPVHSGWAANDESLETRDKLVMLTVQDLAGTGVDPASHGERATTN
jgi:hypothetical protein